MTSSNTSDINISRISSLVAKITSIYGVDSSGDGYLTGFEDQDIKNDRYWTGRKWDLNIQHQIYDMDSAGEEMLYGIHLDYDDEINGLELKIFGYKSFLNYTK